MFLVVFYESIYNNTVYIQVLELHRKSWSHCVCFFHLLWKEWTVSYQRCRFLWVINNKHKLDRHFLLTMRIKTTWTHLDFVGMQSIYGNQLCGNDRNECHSYETSRAKLKPTNRTHRFGRIHLKIVNFCFIQQLVKQGNFLCGAYTYVLFLVAVPSNCWTI